MNVSDKKNVQGKINTVIVVILAISGLVLGIAAKGAVEFNKIKEIEVLSKIALPDPVSYVERDKNFFNVKREYSHSRTRSDEQYLKNAKVAGVINDKWSGSQFVYLTQNKKDISDIVEITTTDRRNYKELFGIEIGDKVKYVAKPTIKNQTIPAVDIWKIGNKKVKQSRGS